MKKATSQILGKEFWIDYQSKGPHEGLPVYSAAEVKWIGRHKDSLTREDLEFIYEWKKKSSVSVFTMTRFKDIGSFRKASREVIAECMNIIKGIADGGKNLQENPGRGENSREVLLQESAGREDSDTRHLSGVREDDKASG